MTTLPKRLKSAIARLGDSFTVGAVTSKAVVSAVSLETAQAYLTTAEITAATLPIRIAYVAHDDASTAGSTLTWDSLSFTIKKVVKARVRGETVAKLLVLA